LRNNSAIDDPNPVFLRGQLCRSGNPANRWSDVRDGIRGLRLSGEGGENQDGRVENHFHPV
jgi:hypothetical protein